MEKKVLVETAIEYGISGRTFYCEEGCKYLVINCDKPSCLYKKCFLFGDITRYIIVPRKGRVPLRHVACIECEKISDTLKGSSDA